MKARVRFRFNLSASFVKLDDFMRSFSSERKELFCNCLHYFNPKLVKLAQNETVGILRDYEAK